MHLIKAAITGDASERHFEKNAMSSGKPSFHLRKYQSLRGPGFGQIPANLVPALFWLSLVQFGSKCKPLRQAHVESFSWNGIQDLTGD